MKKFLKNGIAFVLALSLALSFSCIPAKAASVKGVVAPLTVTVTEDGGIMGSTRVTSWNEPGVFSPDFDSYRVSADIYIPCSIFNKDGGSVFIDPMVQFWFPDLSINGYLEADTHIRVGFDFEKNCPFWIGLGKDDVEITDLPYINNATVVGDMVKVEIADAPVNATFKAADWDEKIGARAVWTDPVPDKGSGDACPCFQIATDRAFKGSFAVANASIKIGNKEYKTNYSKKGELAAYDGEVEGYQELKASSINTSALSVAKTSVKIKKGKSAAVKVTTMFSGDKVKVSSSASKVATAAYKSGKVTITGIKKGKATISVKANGVTKKIEVTVK